MTLTLLLRFYSELLIEPPVIRGEYNYFCIRQGYHYFSLQVKSPGPR